MTLPLVLAEVDLRDFDYMPLQVNRLRDSGLASVEDPAECWFAVLLWCASWHQVPAGSLPDDDMQLSAFAGFGRVVKEWRKVKKGAMRGWIMCDDGRFYHPVVAEKANEAWLARLRHQHKLECDRIRQHNKRHQDNQPMPTFEAWNDARKPVDIQKTEDINPMDADQFSDGHKPNVTRTDPDNRSDLPLKGSEGKGYTTFIPRGTETPPVDNPGDVFWKDKVKTEALGRKLGVTPEQRSGELWPAYTARVVAAWKTNNDSRGKHA